MNIFTHVSTVSLFWISLFLINIMRSYLPSYSPFTSTLVHSYTIRTELYPLSDNISKHLQAPHLNSAKWGLLIRSAGSRISCKTDGALKASCKEALFTNIVCSKVGHWKVQERKLNRHSSLKPNKQINWIIMTEKLPISRQPKLLGEERKKKDRKRLNLTSKLRGRRHTRREATVYSEHLKGPLHSSQERGVVGVPTSRVSQYLTGNVFKLVLF